MLAKARSTEDKLRATAVALKEKFKEAFVCKKIVIVSMHKDDEKELCRETPIASLTLGAERDFVFKHEDKAAKIVDEKLLLQDGLLLLMHAPTNRFWYHAIPQRKACKIPRINLTFRQIKQQ